MDSQTILLIISLLISFLVCLIYYLNQKNYQQKFRKINYVEENCQSISEPNTIDPSLHDHLVHLVGTINNSKPCIDSDTQYSFDNTLCC